MNANPTSAASVEPTTPGAPEAPALDQSVWMHMPSLSNSLRWFHPSRRVSVPHCAIGLNAPPHRSRSTSPKAALVGRSPTAATSSRCRKAPRWSAPPQPASACALRRMATGYVNGHASLADATRAKHKFTRVVQMLIGAGLNTTLA